MISLFLARRERLARRRQPLRIALWADSSDVLRVLQDDGVERMDDGIVLGARSTQEVSRMLTACGIHGLPKTYAELFGLLRFCTRLDSLLSGFQEGDSVEHWEQELAAAERRYEGLSQLLRHLLVRDLAGAAKWHEQHQTVRMSAELFAQGLFFASAKR